MLTLKRSRVNILIVLVFLLLFNSLTSIVFAETGEENSEVSAVEMSRSLIEFYMDERTNIDEKKIASDEYKVYGIFMSNFFIPWSTTLKDIVDEEKVPKTLSEKFFGDEGKKSTVSRVNFMLYDPISKMLAKSKDAEYGLYLKETYDGDKYPITGSELVDKMLGKHKKGDNPDYYLYNLNGAPVLDLNDNAIRAAFQVLFSLSPEFMFSEDVGLRTLKAVYMDGLGNIWGKSEYATSADDSVLILPAALNPVVFSKTHTNTKLPVANVFVMGGLLPTLGEIDSRNEDGLRNLIVPYFNVKEFFQNGGGSTLGDPNNILTIYGVQSVSSNIGNSDRILLNPTAVQNPHNKVKSLLDNTLDTALNQNESKIVLSLDLSKVDDSIKLAGFENSTDKDAFVSYLFRTQVFGLNDIIDDMYFFDFNGRPNIPAIGEGQWINKDSFVKQQRLFVRSLDTRGNTFNFYSPDQYAFSPYVSFLAEYNLKNNEEEKNKYLAAMLGYKQEDYENLFKTDKFKLLKSFIEMGNFESSGVSNLSSKFYQGDVLDAFKLFGTDNVKVFGMTGHSRNMKRVVTGNVWFVNYDKALVVDSLTNTDSIVAFASLEESQVNYAVDSDNAHKVKFPFSYPLGSKDSTLSGEITTERTDALSAFFHNFNSYRVFTGHPTFISALRGIGPTSENRTFTTPWQKDLELKSSIMNDVNHFPGLYWGYLDALLEVEIIDEGTEKERYKTRGFNVGVLPRLDIATTGGTGLNLDRIMGATGSTASQERTMADMQKDIVYKVYGLLSDGPNSYRDKLVKSTQDSWIVSTHRSITGSWVGDAFSVSAGGGGTYASVAGYINTPALGDIPLTSWLLTDYMYIYLFLLLLILVILTFMVLTNIRTLRESVLILILMSFVLLIPQFLIGNVINISNSFGDKIYSSRFNYWAITQHQQSYNTLSNSRGTGNEMDYIIATNAQMASNVYSSDVGVRLKWMAPKKEDAFNGMFSKSKAVQSLDSNLTIFRWLFNSFFNQEEYVFNDPLVTYLYRPYNAIASEADELYSTLSNVPPITRDMVSSTIEPNLGLTSGAPSRLGVPDYRFNLILSDSGDVKYTQEQSELIKKVGVTSLEQEGRTEDQINSYRFWGLNNFDVTDAIFNGTLELENAGLGPNASGDYLTAFSHLTESPFYYFYNVFRSRYTSDNTGEGFKNALLDKNIFKVTDGTQSVNGETRDFLDLEGLFTYVIPYLKQGNEYVSAWTSKHGKTLESYNFNSDVASTITPTDPYYEQFTHQMNKKESMYNLWRIYTPWVDHLYELDVYSHPVSQANKKVYVEDTLNPASYDIVGRPMIFSEADMLAKNYRVSELTDIESRIQSTLNSTYKDLMYLTNYYDFDDNVLLTAAAMIATFNFNREFSSYNILGEDIVLYPQSFELKNFNYDAFMRLILLNSTGEPLMAEKDLYTRIIEKTSFFTGIFLLISDVLGVIVIPAAKVLVLLLLLFLSLVLCISSVVAPSGKIIQTLIRTLGLPSVIFLVSTVSFAFIISLFMGEGLTGYVGGRTPSLGITDPTITMILLTIVDCAFVYVLWKIISMLFKSLRVHSLKSLFTTFALAGGFLSSATGRFSRGLKNKLGGAVSSAVNFGTSMVDSRNMKRAFKDTESGEGKEAKAKTRGVTGTKEPSQGSEEFREKIDNLATNKEKPKHKALKVSEENKKKIEEIRRKRKKLRDQNKGEVVNKPINARKGASKSSSERSSGDQKLTSLRKDLKEIKGSTDGVRANLNNLADGVRRGQQGLSYVAKSTHKSYVKLTKIDSKLRTSTNKTKLVQGRLNSISKNVRKNKD